MNNAAMLDIRADAYAGFDGHPWGYKTRYWTRERCLEVLRQVIVETTGQLPTSSATYGACKKGKLWPPANRLTEYFKTIQRAWLTAGADRKRLRVNGRWSKAEITFLLEHAGDVRLKDIAKQLHRSYQSVRSKLGGAKGGLGLRARETNGYFTGLALAKEYGCSYDRVLRLLANGSIKGRYSARLYRWLIDPQDAEAARHLLTRRRLRRGR